MAITPDGRRAVPGAEDRTLKVWDLESGAVLAEFTCEGAIASCVWAPDGTTIVAGDSTGAVHFLRFEV